MFVTKPAAVCSFQLWGLTYFWHEKVNSMSLKLLYRFLYLDTIYTFSTCRAPLKSIVKTTFILTNIYSARTSDIIIICNFQAFPSKRLKKNYLTWRFCEQQFMNSQSIENKDLLLNLQYYTILPHFKTLQLFGLMESRCLNVCDLRT